MEQVPPPQLTPLTGASLEAKLFLIGVEHDADTAGPGCGRIRDVGVQDTGERTDEPLLAAYRRDVKTEAQHPGTAMMTRYGEVTESHSLEWSSFVLLINSALHRRVGLFITQEDLFLDGLELNGVVEVSGDPENAEYIFGWKMDHIVLDQLRQTEDLLADDVQTGGFLGVDSLGLLRCELVILLMRVSSISKPKGFERTDLAQ